MSRTFVALLAALLLLPAANAADNPAGSWKLSLPGTNVVFLIRIEQKDGKWSGQYLGPTSPEMPKIAFGDVVVAADSLRFTFKIPGEADFQFEGKLPPEAKSGKINGSLLIFHCSEAHGHCRLQRGREEPLGPSGQHRATPGPSGGTQELRMLVR